MMVLGFSFPHSRAKMGARIGPTSIGSAPPIALGTHIDSMIEAVRVQPVGSLFIPLSEVVNGRVNIVRFNVAAKSFLFDPTKRLVRFQLVRTDGTVANLEPPLLTNQDRHHIFLVWDTALGARLHLDGTTASDMRSR